MIALAVIVLLIVGSPLAISMALGALEFAIAICILLGALVRFLWQIGERLTRPATPKPPKEPGRKATNSTRKPDEDLTKIRNVAKTWKSSGSRVGAINLDTGEVFEPAVENEGG